MRMAQTRGGKRDWMKCESSTKGCFEDVSLGCDVPRSLLIAMFEAFRSEQSGIRRSYHEESPDGVVGEDGAGDNKHCEAYETVELVGVDC